MKRPRIIQLLTLCLVQCALGVDIFATAPARHKLVIGVLVDGLDADYIDLLAPAMNEGGFKRLMRDGIVIANADYGRPLDATASAAILFTGASPSTTGIASATTYDRNTHTVTDILADPTSIGNYTDQTYSPRALRVSTLADEVRIAGDGVTQVYAIAADPQQAVILGGHSANCAIWLNDKTGNWASSTFYKDVPPNIASRNRLTPLVNKLDTMQWTPLRGADAYPGLPDHLTHYPFHYIFPRAKAERIDMFKASPAINTEVTDIACEIINAQMLGTHDGIDMLNVAYTISDYPYTRQPDTRFELMDTYLRLDRDIERLLKAAESNSGKDGTVVFVAATSPSGRSRRDDERWSIPGGRFSTRKAISLLNMYLMAIYGNGEWVNGYHNSHFFLNHTLAKQREVDMRTLRIEAADFLARMSGVSDVYTIDDIINGRAGAEASAWRRNTDIDTAGDVVVVVTPGWELFDDANGNTGRDEGKPMVERHSAAIAPVYILAPGAEARVIDTPVDARALAPTVARVLRIRSPNAAALAPLQIN